MLMRRSQRFDSLEVYARLYRGLPSRRAPGRL